MTGKEIEKIVSVATILLPEVVSLINLVATLIQGSDIPEATKEELIARIKKAQESVPPWE